MSQFMSLPLTGAPADFDEVTVLFAGGATLVVQYGGFTFVVDPVFLHHGDHVHLGYDLDTLETHGLASAVDRLPPVDFLLLPQLEDGIGGRAVSRELDRRLPLLTTRQAASALRRKGFSAARGLAVWQTVEVQRAGACVRVTCVPAQRPASVESFLPDAVGSLLEFSDRDRTVRLRVFVSGDREVHGDLREVPRSPEVDLALVPAGATRVVVVLAATDGRAEAVRLVAPRGRLAVPGPTREVLSVEELARAVRETGGGAGVHYVEPGDEYVLRPAAQRRVSEDRDAASSPEPVDVADAPDGDRTVAA